MGLSKRSSDVPKDNQYYLKGLLKNDSKVIDSIFQQYLPGIQNYIIQNKGTKQAAEDIFMDALEVIFRKLKADDLKLTCSFYTYLFEICKRLWWKKLRRKRTENRVTNMDWPVSIAGEEPLKAMEDQEQYQLYKEKFALLNEGCQQILELFLIQQKSMQEITTILGFKSEGYSRKKKHNCKEKLKKLIREDKRFSSLKFDN